MIKVRVKWCTCSVLLFSLSILVLKTQKNTRNELARPVMGTIFLVIHCCSTLLQNLIGNSCLRRRESSALPNPCLLMNIIQKIIKLFLQLLTSLQNFSFYYWVSVVNPSHIICLIECCATCRLGFGSETCMH